MRTDVFVQNPYQPGRRVLIGQCDLPYQLSARALSNLPFDDFGMAANDVIPVPGCAGSTVSVHCW